MTIDDVKMNIAHKLADAISPPPPPPAGGWLNSLPEAFAALDAEGEVFVIGYLGEWYKPIKPSWRVRLHNWLIRIAVLAVALAATVTFMVTAPVCHADSTDDAFLSAMHRHGIHNDKGDAGMINFAHTVCEYLSDGYSMNSLFGIGDLYGKRLTPDDVRFLVQTSAAAYCPQYIR